MLAGRYRLDRLVGEGGSGAVWAAEHIVTGKRVALKILKPSADSPTWRGRFIREARAACAVRHPNVVTVHDVIEADDGSPVLVMDLLEGETLRARLTRERTLSLAAAIEIMLPVISAVETAHSSGVVHRDLKPENIFLGREAGAAGVRVVDFGIAKLTASEGIAPIETLTATGAVIGTIYYMAPEQVYGERDIDHRVDVWSIGVIFYECLAGRRPTEGENAGQVLKLITSGGIPPLHQAAPHVPADIADLVMQMLTREVGGRPGELRAVREVLLRYAGGGTVPAIAERAQAASPSAEASPAASPKATTETFEGVGLASGGTPSQRGAHDATRSPIRARSWAPYLVPLVGIAAVIAAISAGALSPAPPSAHAVAAAEPTSAPPAAPIPVVVEPQMTETESPAPAAAIAPTPRPRPTVLTATASHAKSGADAGVVPATSVSASPRRTSPEGIVETPPF